MGGLREIGFDQVVDEKDLNYFVKNISTPVTTSYQGMNEYSLAQIEQNYLLIANTRNQAQMFQETLNKIYIESKRLDLCQTIFTTFTNIDELDGDKDGHVETKQFVDAIQQVLGKDHIEPLSLEYLS